MRFISKISGLKVYITPRRVSRDPVTNEVMEVMPSIVARFEGFVFKSQEKLYVHGLLRKFAYARENGIAPTFSIHPEDLPEAEEIMKTINPEIAESFTKKSAASSGPDQQNALNEQTQSTLNTLLDVVGKLAESVASLQAKVEGGTSGEETNPQESKSAPKGIAAKKAAEKAAKAAAKAQKAPSSASSGEPNP